MRIIGLAGWSGAGKTTLLVRVIPLLTARGLRVSTVKHAHHGFDIDQPGKDSWEHRQAGATEVLVASGRRWALMHELRDGAEPDLPSLLSHLTAADLVLVEGFKRDAPPKIEVHRPSVGKAMLHPGDPTIIAVASDEALPGVALPVLPLDDPAAVADWLMAHAAAGRPSLGGQLRWPTSTSTMPRDSDDSSTGDGW